MIFFHFFLSQQAIAFYEDIVVGAVCCRVESSPETFEKKLYIMTLGCLAPYRRLGVGAMMLEHVLTCARKDASLKAVYL